MCNGSSCTGRGNPLRLSALIRQWGTPAVGLSALIRQLALLVMINAFPNHSAAQGMLLAMQHGVPEISQRLPAELAPGFAGRLADRIAAAGMECRQGKSRRGEGW